MSLLLHVLSDMLQNPQLLSHIHIWPKPKVKLGPTDSSIRRQRVSDAIATVTNPSKSVSPIGISVSPRWDCNLSTYVHYQNRSHRVWAIGTTEITMQILCLVYYQNWSHRVCVIGLTEFSWPTLWLAYYQNRSHRVCVNGHTEITLCPNPNHIGPTELHLSLTENRH